MALVSGDEVPSSLSSSIQVLSHCERITDAGIHHIVSSLCSEELQVLELDNCPLITDDALEMLR